MCVYNYLHACVCRVEIHQCTQLCPYSVCMHVCECVCVYITAQAFSEGTVLFVTLPQASRCCSPVHQVLMTGSVNINKNLPPSVPAPVVARLAAMQMQALHKQPVKLRAGRLPQPASLQTGEHSDGQVWLQGVCAEAYTPRCVALLVKNREQR